MPGFIFLRRRPWLSLALTAAIVVVFLIARSHGASHVPESGRVLDGGRRFIMAPSTTYSRCAIQVSGHDALAYFGSPRLDVAPACRATEELQANSGTLWIAADNAIAYTPAGVPFPSVNGYDQICQLDSGNGVTLYVWDTGSADYGTSLCDGFVAAGWHEH